MKNLSVALAALLLCALGASGCASMFLHGGRLASRNTETTGALGAWDVPACSGTDGRPFTPPSGVRYYLLQGEAGLELFEQDSSGGGAIVTNQWSDAEGTHFYTWVTSNGWEFVIPGPGMPGVRRVYTAGTSDSRPIGGYTASCPMIVAR